MVTADSVREVVFDAPHLDVVAQAAARSRIDDILRPRGALARLDEIVVWLAGVSGTSTPSVENPSAVIFAADHGVAAEGVSAYPAEVTASMMKAFESQVSSISAMARVAGATVVAIDVGVGRPTGNLRVEPAMSVARFGEAFDSGREAVAGLDADLLILGEMGIGNTTAAAAVVTALTGSARSVGPGTGVDGAVLDVKRRVVDEAVERIVDVDDPMEVLREVGGAEMAAIVGALVESRLRRLPVLLDGYVVGASALALHRAMPEALLHCRAGHRSAEPGHVAVLDELGLRPLLELDMRLGEGSGAMAAVPLVKMACALVNEVPTFAEFFES